MISPKVLPGSGNHLVDSHERYEEMLSRQEWELECGCWGECTCDAEDE